MLDDSFISFRYAKNFSNGFGLVFNPGESPVEGYTCFLWVVLLAIGSKIGFDIVILSKILGYTFSIGTLAALLFLRKNKNINLVNLISSSLIVSTCGAFTVWGSSGMETSLFTFILTLVFIQIEKFIVCPNSKTLTFSGLLLSLLSLTRPEGILITFTLIILIILHNIFILKKFHIKRVLALIIPIFLIVGSHFIFRIIYYQDVLPNTFYNKVGSGIDQFLRGLRYMKSFLQASWFIFIPIILGLILKIKDKSFNKNNSFYMSIFITLVIYFIYIVYIGGDVMPAFRFISPTIPILAILCSYSLMRITTLLHLSKAMFMIIIITILSLNLYQWKYHIKFNKHLKEDTVAIDGKEVGIWLMNNFDKDTSIATNTAGTIPYYSKFRTIDMLGLNDKHIAKRDMPDMGTGFPGHEKTDGKYILSKEPDIIQFGSSLGSIDPVLISDKEIFKLDEFYENYTLHQYLLPSNKILYLYLKE